MEQVQAVQIEDDDGPVTPEEVTEYRQLRPVLLKMVEEWQTLRSSQGCPAMRHILGK